MISQLQMGTERCCCCLALDCRRRSRRRRRRLCLEGVGFGLDLAFGFEFGAKKMPRTCGEVICHVKMMKRLH